MESSTLRHERPRVQASRVQYPNLHNIKYSTSWRIDRKEGLRRWKIEQRWLATPGSLPLGAKKDDKEVKKLLDQLSKDEYGFDGLDQASPKFTGIIAVSAAARRSLMAGLGRSQAFFKEPEGFVALSLILLIGFLYDHGRHGQGRSTTVLHAGYLQTLEYELVPAVKRIGSSSGRNSHGDQFIRCLRDEQLNEVQQTEMEPEKTYIAKLPGHSRPAFVRKRRDMIESPFGLTAIAKAFGPARPRPSASTERPEQPERELRLSPQYLMAPPQQPPLRIEYTHPSPPTHVTQHALTTYPVQSQYVQTLTEPQTQVSKMVSTQVVTKDNRQDESKFFKHSCTSCGKFRSPSYNIQHPLAAGEVPKLSICRKCSKYCTSSERSDDNDESRSHKQNSRKKRRKRRKRGEKARKGVDSSEETKHSSSSEEEISIIRRVRALGRSPKDSHRSRSRSSSFTCNSHRSDRRRYVKERSPDEDVVLVRRVRYTERPNQPRSRSRSRDPPPFRRSPSYENYEKVVERRTSNYDQTRAYPTAEVRRLRRDEIVSRDYSDERDEERATRPILRRSISMVAHPGTATRAEREDHFTRLNTPYLDHIPPHGQASRLSYDFDPNYDVAPVPPVRSVRVVRVQTESESEIQPSQWNHNRERSRVTFGEPSHRSPSPKAIVVESGDPPRRTWRRRYQESEGFIEQDSGDDYYSHEPSGHTRRYLEGRVPSPKAVRWTPPQERYLISAPSDEHHEILHTLQRTHIAPSENHFPIRGRGALGHDDGVRSQSASYYSPNDTRKQYVDALGDKIVYKDV